MIKNQFNRLLNFLLEKESTIILKKYKPKVVSVIGPNKDMTTRTLETAMSKFYFVRAGQNLNLCVLGLEDHKKNFIEWLMVLIEGLALMFLPNHYPEWLIVSSELEKADYVVDTKDVGELKAKNYAVVFDESKLPTGITFHIENAGTDYPVYLRGTVGEHQIEPVMVAFKFCQLLNEHPSVVTKAFDYFEPVHGQMELVKGIQNSLIINDLFEPTPDSVILGLKALKSLDESKRKIALVGDILVLGNNSVEEHRRIGQEISKKIDILVAVGIRSRNIAEEALNNGYAKSKVHQFDDVETASDFIQKHIKEGDVVYMSGSKGVEMEKIADDITNLA